MSLHHTIREQIKDAMRARDALRLETLRGLSALFQNEIVMGKAKPDAQGDLADDAALALVKRSVKQRKDSIEQFEKGNRPELAKIEAEEIAIIEAYMPKAVGEDEIVAAVRATIAEMDSPTMRDMGAVMKNVMAKFAGARVDGKLVSEAVKKQLAGASS